MICKCGRIFCEGCDVEWDKKICAECETVLMGTGSGAVCRDCVAAGAGKPQAVGRKDDAGKPRMSLYPQRALWVTVDVLTYGAEKYGDDNWRRIKDLEPRYYDAAMRHFADYFSGKRFDSESGAHNLAHVQSCVAFMLEHDLQSRGDS